jgi:adenylyltransferase/sulfurtransferase
VPEPWKKAPLTRAELETDATLADLPGYDLVFSMLDEQREPELPEGVIRISKRNPFGQCLERMKAGGKYLVYCNSGKLSLMLVSQIRKHDAEIMALSLKTGEPRS